MLDNHPCLCYYFYMKNILFSPSLLSADFARLGEAVSFINQQGGDLIHIDVMDGTFVPPITIGQQVVSALRPHSDLPFDVHLMTEHPETLVDGFAESGADYITFHHEACIHSHRLVSHIHDLGKKAGISIVPSTPVSAISELLPFVDLVLVMTVNPGFGGQKLIPQCVDKIALLDQIRKEKRYNYLISVDGGINQNTVQSVITAGVDVVVSGSAFFAGTFTKDML